VRTVSEDVIVKAEAIFYDSEKPKMKGPIGQLILSGRRLAFIKYAPRGLIGTAQDYSSNIDEGLKNEGSVEIPMTQVSEAKADSTWGTPYLRVRYRVGSVEKACSIIFRGGLLAAGGVHIRKGPIEQLARTIEQLKQEASTG